MTLLRGIHATYAFLVFAVLFFIFFPLLLIPIALPAKWHLVGMFNRWWAKVFFFLTFFPVKVDCRFKMDSNQPYIFCPNHFSYLDIPAMGLNPHNSIFVGKNDMESIPLFGYMYRKLHITVNRSSLKSRHNTIIKSMQAIDEGKSLVIFPEGGIITTNPPFMHRFKTGAFRTAIEKQIPVIPVTIPYNWIILPDSKWLPVRKTVKIIFHEPIATTGMTLDDLDHLTNTVFKVIQDELIKENNTTVN